MVSIFSIIPAPFARVYAFPPAPPLFLSRGSPRTLPGAPPLDPVGGSALLAVRKGRCASPPRRHPSTPLLTGLPPRFFRHWRRSAPAVRKGRCASPPRRLPSTPLLTGLPPRFFRHWRRSAPPPLRWVVHQRQKGNEKTRPFVQPSYAPSTTRKKVVATASRCEGVYNRAGEPSEPFSGEEPRRNERSPGKGTLPGPSGWSPRRRGQRRLHPPRRGLLPQGSLTPCCATLAARVGPA